MPRFLPSTCCVGRFNDAMDIILRNGVIFSSYSVHDRYHNKSFTKLAPHNLFDNDAALIYSQHLLLFIEILRASIDMSVNPRRWRGNVSFICYNTLQMLRNNFRVLWKRKNIAILLIFARQIKEACILYSLFFSTLFWFVNVSRNNISTSGTNRSKTLLVPCHITSLQPQEASDQHIF